MRITFSMTKQQSKKIKGALDKEGVKENFALLAQPLLASQTFIVRSLNEKQYDKLYKVMEKVFND